jgi:hypothetical protein
VRQAWRDCKDGRRDRVAESNRRSRHARIP